MPTLAHYADASYVHEKYHFHSKLRQKESKYLGYARAWPVPTLVTSRTAAESRAAPIFHHYWLRDVTINDKQRLTKRYKRLLWSNTKKTSSIWTIAGYMERHSRVNYPGPGS